MDSDCMLLQHVLSSGRGQGPGCSVGQGSPLLHLNNMTHDTTDLSHASITLAHYLAHQECSMKPACTLQESLVRMPAGCCHIAAALAAVQ